MYKINGNDLFVFSNEDNEAQAVVELKSRIKQNEHLVLTNILDDCVINDTHSRINYIVVDQLENDNSPVFIGVSSDFFIEATLDTPIQLHYSDEFLAELEEDERKYYDSLIKNQPQLTIGIDVSTLTHHSLEENYLTLSKQEGDVGVTDTSLQSIESDVDLLMTVGSVNMHMTIFEEYEEIIRIVRNQVQLGLAKKLPIIVSKRIVDVGVYKSERIQEVSKKYKNMQKSIDASFKKGGDLAGFTKTGQVSKNIYNKVTQ